MDGLYDEDTVIWSEHQVELLDQIARGLRPNEAPDWPNIIEEIGEVGRSAIAAVKGLLLQAFLHELKAEAWPGSRDARNWRRDALQFRISAAYQFTPSMQQRIDLAEIYQDAIDLLPDEMDGLAPLPVARTCPNTFEDLLNERETRRKSRS